MKKICFAIFLVFARCVAVPLEAMPGGNLFHCLAEACYEEPVDMVQLAHIHAGKIIDSFYRSRQKTDGFNGTVIVARHGKPIYEASFGYADLKNKIPISTQTPIQLASVSKPFTATAVLLLAQANLLNLDDTLQHFFPEFPYPGISIRHLLSHRSGLPEYIYQPKEVFGVASAYLNNHQLLEYFITKKPPVRMKPDRMFHYCNSNYAILALVVEKIAHMPFSSFMQQFLFSPLGMTNSFVYDGYDSCSIGGALSYDKSGRVWQNNIHDGVVGDKGIYASAEDMLRWDNALRNGVILSEEMLREAYTPRSLDKYSFAKEKDKNYGYGWRIARKDDNTNLIYHNGFWHGSNNVFARDLDNGYTIIVLGNKSNSRNYWTQPVWEVLHQLKDFTQFAAASL